MILIEALKLVNFDLFEKYFDLTPELIFGEFRETAPLDERFEEAGYDSANFFLLCGPIVFMAIAFLIWIPLRKCLSIAIKDCKDNYVTKRLKKGARSQLIVLRFLTESAIELGLASLITAV